MSAKWGDSLYLKELEGWYLRLCRPKGRMGALSHLSCALGTWQHINGYVCVTVFVFHGPNRIGGSQLWLTDCVCWSLIYKKTKQNKTQPVTSCTSGTLGTSWMPSCLAGPSVASARNTELGLYLTWWQSQGEINVGVRGLIGNDTILDAHGDCGTT